MSAQQSITDITHRYRLSLHSYLTSLPYKRKSLQVHSGLTDEKWDVLFWLGCQTVLCSAGGGVETVKTVCKVLLSGKIGMNWWRCPHSTPLLPRPLLSSTCSNTTPVRPIQQTIIIPNISHSHTSLLSLPIFTITWNYFSFSLTSLTLFSEINKPVTAVHWRISAVATLHRRLDFHSEKSKNQRKKFG